jgi:hypothetical protein
MTSQIFEGRGVDTQPAQHGAGWRYKGGLRDECTYLRSHGWMCLVAGLEVAQIEGTRWEDDIGKEQPPWGAKEVRERKKVGWRKPTRQSLPDERTSPPDNSAAALWA